MVQNQWEEISDLTYAWDWHVILIPIWFKNYNFLWFRFQFWFHKGWFRFWFRFLWLPRSMIPIPIPIPVASDSDADSDSSVSQKTWFRFWFRFQRHVVLVPIPIPTNKALIPILIPESDSDSGIIYNSDYYCLKTCLTHTMTFYNDQQTSVHKIVLERDI